MTIIVNRRQKNVCLTIEVNIMQKTEFLTVKEVSRLLKIPEGSIYTNICRGSFPIQYVKIGRLTRFFKEDVEHYLDSLPRQIGSKNISDVSTP